MNISIREYKDCDKEDLNKILKEAFNEEKKGNSGNNIELVALNDNQVVGYLVINKMYDSIKNINYAYINYVCVLKEYRNKHIGYNLLKKAILILKSEKISYIELTSNKNREAAQHLYKKLGFEIRETNVFRKEII